MPEPVPPEIQPGEFERRHAVWVALHARFGPARSYPYAWRLPELARREGLSARLRAALALANTLYAMGRFDEALAALPDSDKRIDAGAMADHHHLRARCLWLRDEADAALAEIGRDAHPDGLTALHARAAFHYLMDDPGGAGTVGREYSRIAEPAGGKHAAWAALLADWSRPGNETGLARAHAALAWLRVHFPAKAAEGEAVHAEARFRQAPAQALVWLDHALDEVERFGQHHLKARLLHRKSLALEAVGQLGEAGRFLDLARETARRQGAWRYLRDMAS
jgi:hypothetical protein